MLGYDSVTLYAVKERCSSLHMVLMIIIIL